MMAKRGWIAVVGMSALVGAVAIAGGGEPAKPEAPGQELPGPKAEAVIEGRSGSSLTGTAEFQLNGARLFIIVSVKGAPPGIHAVHIHEKGDCSASDAKSAGDHFNPEGTHHGAPENREHHAGDFGNMAVDADGTGSLKIYSGDLSLEGRDSVIGRAIVIHEKADDFMTQPSGNSGARIGCGVIKQSGPTKG
jgi:Cu-Zn family superoxide dismutase